MTMVSVGSAVQAACRKARDVLAVRQPSDVQEPDRLADDQIAIATTLKREAPGRAALSATTISTLGKNAFSRNHSDPVLASSYDNLRGRTFLIKIKAISIMLADFHISSVLQ